MENKRCPFCGSTNTQIMSVVAGGTKQSAHTEFFVNCYNCGAQGPNAITGDDAERMWNMRRQVMPGENITVLPRDGEDEFPF